MHLLPKAGSFQPTKVSGSDLLKDALGIPEKPGVFYHPKYVFIKKCLDWLVWLSV